MSSIKKTFFVVGLLGEDTKSFQTEVEAIDYLKTQESKGYFFIHPAYQCIPDGENSFRASIIMPIWECPNRTIRAINSVINQDTSGWQLICIGDGCPKFAEVLAGSWFKEMQAKAYINGNEIIGLNTEHYGGFGYHQRELAKNMATGKWTMYLDNDDVLLPHHVSTRLKYVESGDDQVDLLYYSTWLEPDNWHRDAALLYGKIGHAEVMFRTEFLKTLTPLSNMYGHDWLTIKEAIDKGARTRKCGGEWTYIVTKKKRAGD